MKIYMDVCCLSRPFDNQSQDKIRFETEAVVSILNRCNRDRSWELIGSDVIMLEASKTPDLSKRQKILLLHDSAGKRVKSNDVIKLRASKFREHNIKLFDSLHLAAAEYANADILLTTDVKFINAASCSGANVRVTNPLTFYMEVINNG